MTSPWFGNVGVTMFPSKHVVQGLAIVACIAAPAANAIVTTFEPFEANAAGAITVLTDRFHRQEFDGVGATATFQSPLFVDENGDGKVTTDEYQVRAGETWDWIWRVIALDNNPFAGSFELGRAHVEFEGTNTFCFLGTPFCGILGGIQFTLTNKCLSEGDYEIELLHNGVSIGRQPFRPTRFVPKAFAFGFDANPEPKIAGSPGPTSTNVFAEVVDDLGCNELLSDVTARFTNTIAPSSSDHEHAHTHFGSSDVGTGDYSCSSFYPSCRIIDQEKTIVEGKTSKIFGGFDAPYASGGIGVAETVKLTLKREATAKDPQEVQGVDKEATLDIRYPSLFRVIPSEIAATFADAGGCPQHDPLPHWLTVLSITKLSNVTRLYEAATGRQLSLNDASLPFGGLYENKGGGGRSAACHDSHRVGIDIDINHGDSGLKVLRCPRKKDGSLVDPNCVNDTITGPGGTPEPLIDFVRRLFSQVNGNQIPESGSIHFRFPQ